jgi:hypothetical protein
MLERAEDNVEGQRNATRTANGATRVDLCGPAPESKIHYWAREGHLSACGGWMVVAERLRIPVE